MRTISLAAGTVLDVGPADAVDLAADAGFTSVGIWFDVSTWTDAVADEVRALATRLDGTDIRLVLEFLPILGVRTLPQALAIVEAADDPCLGVLVDNLHLSRAGHVPADLAHVHAHLLPYIQVCDAPAVPADAAHAALMQEALHGRLLPGDGGPPIAELLAAVPAVPISLELRSQPLCAMYPDPVERAKAVRLAMERVLATTQL